MLGAGFLGAAGAGCGHAIAPVHGQDLGVRQLVSSSCSSAVNQCLLVMSDGARFVCRGTSLRVSGRGGRTIVENSTCTPVGAATSPEVLAGRAQAGVLRLPRGRSTDRFQITALAPPRHSYDVRIVAPASADVGVHILTWYEQSLDVIGSTRSRDFCHVSGRRSVCFLPFPRLEAQLAGPWTVIATKRSAPPATVRIVVTFNRANAG